MCWTVCCLLCWGFWHCYLSHSCISCHQQMELCHSYLWLSVAYHSLWASPTDNWKECGQCNMLQAKLALCWRGYTHASKQEMIFQIPIHCLIDWSVPTSTTGLCCQSLSKHMSTLKHLQCENKYHQCTLMAQSAEEACVSWNYVATVYCMQWSMMLW